MPSPNVAPIKNPTPRDQFREKADNISLHRTLVDSPQFERGVHFTMLEYQRMLSTQVKDGNSAAAAGYKLQGAIEIMGVLRMLAEPAPSMPKLASQSLDHNA
jgi:hypothetical protein